MTAKPTQKHYIFYRKKFGVFFLFFYSFLFFLFSIQPFEQWSKNNSKDLKWASQMSQLWRHTFLILHTIYALGLYTIYALGLSSKQQENILIVKGREGHWPNCFCVMNRHKSVVGQKFIFLKVTSYFHCTAGGIQAGHISFYFLLSLYTYPWELLVTHSA